MSATKLLPPDIARDLNRAVKKAASDALLRDFWATSNIPDAPAQTKLTAELRSCLDQALSELGSDFNTETTVLGRLFDELWCMVFSFLPMADLVQATHVCRKWRNLALGHSALWCQVDYTSDRHDDDCSCLYEGSAGYNDCYDGPGTCNQSLVEIALARCGGTLPISLHVHLVQTECNHEDLGYLARTVKPYLPRLAALRIRANAGDAPPAFLQHFDCLPALRTLSVKVGSVDWKHSGGAPFLHRGSLGLPMLEEMELRVPKNADLKVPDELPALNSLHLRFRSTAVISAYLQIAPRVRKLILRPSSLFVPDAESDEDFREQWKTRGIAEVRVIEIPPTMEPAMLSMFDSDALTHILLDYKKFDSNHYKRDDSHHPGPGVEGVRILRHLEAVDELSICRRPGRQCEQLVVSARSPKGQTRALTFVWPPDTPAFRSSDLWANLSAPPRSLVVDARLWSTTLELLPPQMASLIKKLTVLVSPSLDLSELAQGTPNIAGAFAEIEEVEIAGHPWADAPPVSAPLLSFLLGLCPPKGVLERLVLRHVRVNERTAFEGAARVVVFQ